MVERIEPELHFSRDSERNIERHQFINPSRCCQLYKKLNCIKNIFSIMVDESSYISNREQVDFCLHLVDEDLHSHEDFISLYEMEKTDATTMINVIKDIFLRLDLDKAKLHGQCYDGFSTMMGKKKAVATIIKRDVQALALPTHFYTHSLNLACEDWIKNSTIASNSLNKIT